MHLLYRSVNRQDLNFAEVRAHLPNTGVSHGSIHPGPHYYLMGHRHHLCQCFQCTPIAKPWDTSLPGTCINPKRSFIGNAVPSIPSILTDVAILSFPVHIVWGLQATLVNRLSVVAVFLLGPKQ